MDGCDVNTPDTKFIDLLFDVRDDIYIAASSASVEVVELINMVIHE